MKIKENFGRTLYILEAAFEYHIALMFSGSFLATLTGALGMPDSLTGIVSSFISMGCLFQLISIFIQIKKQKSFVLILSVLNQLLFSILYVIPLLGFPKNTKIVVFIIAIFSAYIIYNVAHPKKTNWLMAQVDSNSRGNFTATKQIFSLITGMIFSFSMGAVIDHFAESDNKQTAFLLSAIVIFVLMIIHSLTMLFTRDIEVKTNSLNAKTIFGILKDKNAIAVMIFFVIYHVGHGITAPFYGTYQINELGMSLTLVSLLTILGSGARILVERPFGKYADKKSFAKMTEKSLVLLGLAYLTMAFATPANGKILVAVYLILHSMAMAGISSAVINLVFEFVGPSKRADALAMTQAASGTAGFLATLAASPLVSFIQSNQNKLFGITVYSQQVLSFLGVVIVILGFLYVKFFLVKRKESL